MFTFECLSPYGAVSTNQILQMLLSYYFKCRFTLTIGRCFSVAVTTQALNKNSPAIIFLSNIKKLLKTNFITLSKIHQ